MNDIDKDLPTLLVSTHGRDFVLPYIRRALPEYNVVTQGEADHRVDIVVAGEEQDADDAIVLVCPEIIGTGMTGLPMEMARKIASGSYFHIAGNEARIAVIHAVDVAAAVALTIGQPGKYAVSDGANPTFTELAEALAWRISQKRILTLKPSWARWLMSPKWRRVITTDRLIDTSALLRIEGFTPNIVTEYLRNHVYDDESL